MPMPARAQNEWDKRDMQDWQETDIEPEEGFEQARKEAAVDYQWPVTCDGTGVLDEEWIAPDETRAIPCKGCPACLGREVRVLAGDDRPEPEWMRDPELIGFGVRRKPAASETSMPARKITVDHWNGRQYAGVA